MVQCLECLFTSGYSRLSSLPHRRVATLCAEWEAVLLYGIKRSKSKGLGRQIAGLVKNDGSSEIFNNV